MNKKYFFISIIILTIGITILSIYLFISSMSINKVKKMSDSNNNIQYILSDTEIYNSKNNSYTDYNEINSNVFALETSVNDTKEEFVLKEKNGYICIYQVNEQGEFFIRKETDIFVRYLPKLDQIKLKTGIRVKGKKALNKILEDYE